jgi:sugar lactone lactonase YvrE
MSRPVKILAGGIYFGEGPRWHGGRLWFSDFFGKCVKSVSLSGDLRTEFEIDDQPSGLGWMPDGSLLVVSMTKRQVLRRTRDGNLSVHADLNGVATFHCNDMVVASDGRAFVGNFGFDLNAEMAKGPITALSPHQTAKLASVSSGGAVRVAADDMHFPNGSVVAPDGRTLIVAETFGRRLTAFDLGADGALTNRRVWAETGARLPDGICLNAKGAIWIANPLAPECALIAEGGEVLDVIDTTDPCYACMLGGEDGKTLFMLTAPPLGGDTSDTSPRGKVRITSVDVPHAGLP